MPIQHESSYTRAITDLIALVESPTENADSLVQDAAVYFKAAANLKETITTLNNAVSEKRDSLQIASKKDQEALKNELDKAEAALKEELTSQQEDRLARLERATVVCEKILALSEGKDLTETLEKSAKFLGTILLLSPGEGRRLQKLHQRMKPCYKAVLSIRLLDALMQQKQVKNKYLNTHYEIDTRFQNEDRQGQLATVIFPIMLVALFQDIGMQHPDVQKILKGPDNQLDPYRVLPVEERKELLKLNFQHTLDYLEYGLGMHKYVGNSREERDAFNQTQTQAVAFSKLVMKDILKPRHGLGEIIKIPQIYSSVVLSTKREYKAIELPKACLLIEQLAEKGSLNKIIAELFTKMVGHFPQGYGVTYIPTTDQGEELDRYEYAIVIGLYPDNLYEPECRIVTRNLTFISSGPSLTVKRGLNLYFPKTRQKLAKIDKEKLKEILQQLKQEVTDEHIENLIPPCWLPHEYFSQKQHQNLWIKAY
ncbi:hypothetical protein [Alteromonas flava]|uniref:hypothetical protein n=1 Tax=Alteromonas flava TaxID=2048003 RepID=UPI000C284243|nr:hypothetical protein [Alteromonas flava]